MHSGKGLSASIDKSKLSLTCLLYYRNRVAGNRKICLIIDEHERDKDRLLAYAADKDIDAQVRFLPAGDYVWILSPPLYNVNERYLGNDPGNEMVSINLTLLHMQTHFEAFPSIDL